MLHNRHNVLLMAMDFEHLLTICYNAVQGLDPASRRNLWDAVKSAKEDKAIILTTHSMKEAEVLCDRLGIFVNGRLVVIGNPKELTSRYGGYMVRMSPEPVVDIFKMQ